MSSSLNAARRRRELTEAAETTVDLLVVGLGVTGAGVALDAAARGLTVAAMDARDLAFGTSRWSSKLVHGGLRYLASGQLDVAHESAVERGILMERTAPHLTRALPFVMPLHPQTSPSHAALARTGLRAGDLLRAAARTSRRTLPGPRHLTAARALETAPALRRAGLRGALLSWDGQLSDDARLVTAIARTAAAYGARVLTRCRALALSGDGADVRDELTGETLRIRARAVVNAAGVWAGGLAEGVRLRPSRGTHLVLRSAALGGLSTGLHVPIPGELNRFALVLPQGDGRVYAGLTDEPLDGPIPDVPEAPEPDIGFLLDVLGTALETPLRREEVAGAFAGLRPLLDDEHGRTADVSRRHAVLTSPAGVVTVVGGKLTTYRRMAQDAVDAALRARGLAAGPCRTARLPLVGAPGSAATPGDPHGLRARAALAGSGLPRRLLRRYGVETAEVLALGAADPGLLEPVAAGVLGVELAWAVRHEGALDESDLLDRRTRIGLVEADRKIALPAARTALGLG